MYLQRFASGMLPTVKNGVFIAKPVLFLRGNPTKKEKRFYARFKNIHILFNKKGYNNSKDHYKAVRLWIKDFIRHDSPQTFILASNIDRKNTLSKKRIFVGDNLSCHKYTATATLMKNNNISNEFFDPHETSIGQPVDRHLARSIQVPIENKFDEIREEQADKIEKGLPHKRYNLSDIRKLVAQWYSDAIETLKTRNGLLQQAWTNCGIFEPIDGSNDSAWEQKVLRCEKRRRKKNLTEYAVETRNKKLLEAYKEMAERMVFHNDRRKNDRPELKQQEESDVDDSDDEDDSDVSVEVFFNGNIGADTSDSDYDIDRAREDESD